MEIFSLGVAYYPDYLHASLLGRSAEGDIRALSIEEQIRSDYHRMRACGLSLIRMGEFSWSHVEPEPGRLDFSRFLLALNLASDFGLNVIFCTPTATPPKWLCDRYPEILPRTRQQQTIAFGGRRHYDPTSPIYQSESRRITQLYVEALGQHPSLVGWQVDNEFGHHGSWQSLSTSCKEHFQLWLQERYQDDIDDLNERWFTCFWSQRYRSFSEIDLPMAGWNPPNPHLEMEFRRFMTVAYVRFQAEQVAIIRAGSPQTFVTHNLIPRMFDLDLWQLTKDLDTVGYDHYQVDRLPNPVSSSSQFSLMRSLKRGRKFLVLEQQPLQVNWQRVNRRLPMDWLFLWGAQAAFLGASSMFYFSWRRFAGGVEQFHDAIVPHDLRVPQSRQEKLIQAKQAFFSEAGRAFGWESLPNPRARILIIHNVESIWAHEAPQQSEAWRPTEQVDKVYEAFLALGMLADFGESIAACSAQLADYDLLVLPGYAFALTDAERAQIKNYLDQGGRLLTLPRTGFKDPVSRMVPFPLQLFEQNEFYFEDFGALDVDEKDKVLIKDGVLEAELWCEKLQLPAGSPWEALAVFADGLYAGSPAVIKRSGFAEPGAAVHLAFWPVITEAFVDFLQSTFGLETQVRSPLGSQVQTFPLQLEHRQFLAAINFGETACGLTPPRALRGGLLASVNADLQLETHGAEQYEAGAEFKLPPRTVWVSEWQQHEG